LKFTLEKNKAEYAPLFIGSKKEFNKYFSGYGRNLEQSITKSYKKSIAKCEHCGTIDHQLDAAHVKGKERKDIIDRIITKFEINGILEISLNVYEQEFLMAHNPINEIVKILCKSCHREYDNGPAKSIKVNELSEVSVANYYEATSLVFRKNVIDQLSERDNFTIFITSTKEAFTMSKQDFCSTFDNVASSDSYNINGVYSYSNTPKKAYRFLTTNCTNKNQESREKSIAIKSQEKIGKYVKDRIKQLLEEDLISQDEILRLQSPDYSKRISNSNYEILKSSTRNKKDHLGKSRYYKEQYINGYWLTSQWYEYQREGFDNWVLNLKNK